MAEIRVEKKKTTSVWPWILAVIVVALLLWAVTAFNRNPNRNDAGARTSALQPAPAVISVDAPVAYALAA